MPKESTYTYSTYNKNIPHPVITKVYSGLRKQLNNALSAKGIQSAFMKEFSGFKFIIQKAAEPYKRRKWQRNYAVITVEELIDWEMLILKRGEQYMHLDYWELEESIEVKEFRMVCTEQEFKDRLIQCI